MTWFLKLFPSQIYLHSIWFWRKKCWLMVADTSSQVHPVLESNPGLILVSLNTCGSQQVQCYHLTRPAAAALAPSFAGLISLSHVVLPGLGGLWSPSSRVHTRVREDSDFGSLALIKLLAGQEFGERDRRGSCVIWDSPLIISSLISHIATSHNPLWSP